MSWATEFGEAFINAVALPFLLLMAYGGMLAVSYGLGCYLVGSPL